MIMLVKEVNGFSKVKALEATGLEVSMEDLKNATQAWKKNGSPVNSKDLKNFMAEYLKKQKITGAYIVVEPSADDTRIRPYTVINEVTEGKRKAKTVYQVTEAALKINYKTTTQVDAEGVSTEVEVPTVVVKELGIVAAKASKKDEAMKAMKDLIAENKRDYAIKITREITEGKEFAAYGQYTPSTSAKQGKFIFFTKE